MQLRTRCPSTAASEGRRQGSNGALDTGSAAKGHAKGEGGGRSDQLTSWRCLLRTRAQRPSVSPPGCRLQAVGAWAGGLGCGGVWAQFTSNFGALASRWGLNGWRHNRQ
mgnify:CR=1 FL=1